MDVVPIHKDIQKSCIFLELEYYIKRPARAFL